MNIEQTKISDETVKKSIDAGDDDAGEFAPWND